VVLLTGDVAILLTFGMIFPPLAAVICFSIVVNTLYTQMILGRFIYLAERVKPSSSMSPYLAIVRKECNTVGSLLAMSLPPITVLATMFWSFVVFEMLAGVWGSSKRTLWVLGFLPVVVLVWRLIQLSLRRVIPENTYTTSDHSFVRYWLQRLFGVIQRDNSKPQSVEVTSEEEKKSVNETVIELGTLRNHVPL
jgi:hypothetical protein